VSYSSIVEMANSASLIGRITAGVAGEGIDNPEAWTRSNIYKIVSQPDWDTQWDYALGTKTVNVNPDFGIRTDVISDLNILAAVQAVAALP